MFWSVCSSIYLSGLAMCQGVCNQTVVLFLAFRGLITGCWHQQLAPRLFQKTASLSRGWTEWTSRQWAGHKKSKCTFLPGRQSLAVTKWWCATVILSQENRWSSSNFFHRYFFTGTKVRLWKAAGHNAEVSHVFLGFRLQKEPLLQPLGQGNLCSSLGFLDFRASDLTVEGFCFESLLWFIPIIWLPSC